MPQLLIVKYLLNQKGGIEKRFHNYVEEFLNRGYSITVAYGSAAKDYQFKDQINYQKLSVGPVPSRKLRKVTFSIVASRFVKRNEEKYDLVLSMGRTGRSDIVIAAGNYPNATAETIARSNVFQNNMYYADKLTFDRSKLIIAASEMVRNELIDLFKLPSEKIKVVLPPIRTKDYYKMNEQEIEDLQSKFTIDQRKINFLFVSTGHKRKGGNFLIDLFRELGDPYHLFVAGDRLDNDLENIHQVGFVNRPQELYNCVDYLIHPASYEAFGQVVIESILCGTPVIISNKVGAKEIVKGDMGIVVDGFELDTWLNLIKGLQKKTLKDQNDLSAQFEVNNHIDKILGYWENL